MKKKLGARTQKNKGSKQWLQATVWPQVENLEKLHKCLEMNNMPRMSQEEIENMNHSITSGETESLIKKFPTKKVHDQSEFYHIFKEELIIFKLIKKLKENECLLTHLWGQHHPDTKNKDTTEKENSRPITYWQKSQAEY